MLNKIKVKTTNNIFEKAIIWLLLLSPILHIYGFGPVNLCDLLTWSALLIGFYKQRISFKLPYKINRYFVYLLIVTVFSCLSSTVELFGRCFGVIHSFLVFALFFSIKDCKYLYKSYKLLSLASLSLFYIQEVSYATIGIRVSGLIPFLPLNSEFSNFENTYSFREFLTHVTRSSSFFSEPAHFAQFLFPFIPLVMYFEKGWKRFLYVSISIIALFLLKSGNGIVGLGVILIVYSIYYLRYLSAFKKIILLAFISLFIAVGVGYIVSSEIGQKYMSRSEEISTVSDDADDASGFVRIYLGYFIYDDYGVVEKIFGINNFSKLQTIINSNKFGYLLDGVLYFNTIQNFLLKAGVIGLIFYLLWLMGIYRKNNICGKAIVITFFVLSFMSSQYLTPIMILYLLFGHRIKMSYIISSIDQSYNNSSICVKK
jgi:hypothetical protein